MGNPVYAPSGGTACADVAKPVLPTSNPRSRRESLTLKAHRNQHGIKTHGRVSGKLQELAPFVAFLARMDSGTQTPRWPRILLSDAVHPFAG